MKRVIVASNNPIKIEVASLVFQKVFPDEEFEIIGIKSESGVPDQPFDDETYLGAKNRLDFVRNQIPDADYWISQEGGLCTEDNKVCNRAWILVCDKTGFIGSSSTASLTIPNKIMEHINNGHEFGVAADIFFNVKDSGTHNGAAGYITNNLLDRTNYYLPSAIIALCQVVNKEWYK